MTRRRNRVRRSVLRMHCDASDPVRSSGDRIVWRLIRLFLRGASLIFVGFCIAFYFL